MKVNEVLKNNFENEFTSLISNPLILKVSKLIQFSNELTIELIFAYFSDIISIEINESIFLNIKSMFKFSYNLN